MLHKPEQVDRGARYDSGGPPAALPIVGRLFALDGRHPDDVAGLGMVRLRGDGRRVEVDVAVDETWKVILLEKPQISIKPLELHE